MYSVVVLFERARNKTNSASHREDPNLQSAISSLFFSTSYVKKISTSSKQVKLMNSINALSFSSSSPALLPPLTRRCSPRLSFSTPRRSRYRSRRRTKRRESNLRKTVEPSSDEQSIKLVLDFDRISSLHSSRFQRVVSSAEEALSDLRTLVAVDPETRTIQFSCRKSTIQLVGGFLLCGFVVVFTVRAFFKLAMGFKARFRPKEKVLVRRDRSLGGREVIVGTTVGNQRFRALESPLSPGRSDVGSGPVVDYLDSRVRVKEKLPKWWPELVENPVAVFDREAYQREADKLIRAIVNKRTSGEDILEDDILQLRQICRTSGVRVSFETTNTRDSLYRASIDMVLNACCREPNSSPVFIDGEDARQFIAGLAANIGLEKTRAARMVSAAVAGRTRFRFLQAWALEMQGKHSEAVTELSKICSVFLIFPPEESSPEMEMVARSLEKLLKVEQRELLLAMLVGVCGEEENHRTAAEALGLLS